MSWQPILLGGAVALVLARRGLHSPLEQTLAAAALAVSGSFVLDDPAATTLASSPSSLGRRRATRLALALPMAATIWTAVILVAHLQGGAVGAAFLEAATLLAVVFASAAFATGHIYDGNGGVVAAPTLFVLLATAMSLPPRWALYPVGDHQRTWALLLTVAVAALFLASRDSAAPPRLASAPRA